MQQNNCAHTQISRRIFNIISITLIVAIVVVVNFFHLPVYFHGIEIERFELGLTVALLLVGKTSLRNLIIAVAVSTIVDQLQHGHNLITIPFEILFNTLLLIVFSFFYHLYQGNKKWKKLSIFFGCLICTVIAKTIYFGAIMYIFVPEVNIFNFKTTSADFNWNSFFVLSLYILLVVVKFSVILGTGIYFNKRFN